MGFTSLRGIGGCHTYGQALMLWSRAPAARTPKQTREFGDARPLDGFAKWHYRVCKTERDHIQFWLYRECIVEYTPTECIVDARDCRNTTAQFAETLSPARFRNYLGQRCVIQKNHLVNPRTEDAYFVVDVPLHFMADGEYHYTLNTEGLRKPTRPLLSKSLAKLVRADIAPILRRIDVLWAMGDGRHPWEGVALEDALAPLEDGQTPYDEDIINVLPYSHIRIVDGRVVHTLVPAPKDVIKRSIRTKAYERCGAYKQVPYDQLTID